MYNIGMAKNQTHEVEEQKVRCFLVGETSNTDSGDNLAELSSLAETLEMEIAGKMILTRREMSPVYGMGSGKAKEISGIAHETESDCIIFDFDIEPTKQRNWEKLAKIPVLDRQEVILRIFAARAQTKEATLQVELARLIYSLPRLAHSYGDMARQRGGNYGSKGSGETQLELDARRIREKIAQVKKELARVEQNRQTQHKKRIKYGIPTCALVGYTNAGKSSLLNALTGADVLVENKLFATLDPTTRRIKTKNGTSLLITDTVGFISRLPHTLIDAFKSTLSEAKDADLLFLVLDASSENCLKEYESVCNVLKEIGAEKSEHVILLNKADIAEENSDNTLQLSARFPEAIWTSAKTKQGLDVLMELAEQMFLPNKNRKC